MSMIHERYVWLAKYIMEKGYNNVDILDKEFVIEYVAKFNFKFYDVAYGAPKCPQLSKDLSKMAKIGYLKRRKTAITMPLQGMPKWAYVYSINKWNIHFLLGEEYNTRNLSINE